MNAILLEILQAAAAQVLQAATQDPAIIKVINALTGMLTVLLGIITAVLSFFSLRRSQKNSSQIKTVDTKVNGVLTAATQAATVAGQAIGLEAGRQLQKAEAETARQTARFEGRETHDEGDAK